MWFASTDPPRRHEDTKAILDKKIFVASCLRGVIVVLIGCVGVVGAPFQGAPGRAESALPQEIGRAHV